MSGAAVSAGKSLRDLSRALRRGGAPPPAGRIATRVDPGLIGGLATGLGRGCALVTGTKGTTTTTRIMAGAARSAGLSVITNSEGAGSLPGIAASLAASSGRGGVLRSPDTAIGMFEVNEGALPAAIEALRPRLVVLTNIFRGQAGEHFEAGAISRFWKPALGKLAPNARVVLNADDPVVAYLGEGLRAEVTCFGLEDRQWARPGLEHAADARHCPRCDHELRYKLSFYAHLGHYACGQCGWRRTSPVFAAFRVELGGTEGGRCQVSTPAGDRTLALPLAGLRNACNTLAAAAGASYILGSASLASASSGGNGLATPTAIRRYASPLSTLIEA